MKELVQLLKRCILFRDIPEDMIQDKILPLGKLQEVPKDNYLIITQEKVDFFGVVVSGSIHSMHLFGDGSYSIIDAIGEAEIVGADLMWTSSRIAPYHAIAAMPSQVLFFPTSMLSQPGMLPEEYRLQIIGKTLTLISHDNIRKEYRLAILAQKGLRERIMTYLSMQAGKRRTNTFVIPFSREELASYLCVNRSALSHELSLMRQEGLISFRRNEFTLLRREEIRIPSDLILHDMET